MVHGENQQRSLDQALFWLGGIIDGEGCFNMARHLHRKSKTLIAFTPSLKIVNTDERMISEIARILKTLQVAHHVDRRRPRKGNQLPVTEIVIRGLKRLSKALPILIPTLICKRARAEAMLAFCMYRLSQPCIRNPYTGREMEWVKLIREENAAKNNRSKPLTDCTFGSRFYRDEDTVGSSAKSEEVGRNDQPTV